MTPPPPDIRSLYALPATDQTVICLELAGMGNRLMAALIDLTILGLLMALSFLAALQARAIHPELSASLTYLLPFCVSFGVMFAQEWLWHGRTVGKALMGLRVVRVNGQPIGLWEALGRNLFRLIDVWMMGVGLLVILFSRHEQRFGDFLVGTLVINDQTLLPPSLTAEASPAGGIRAPSPALPILQDAGRRLSPEEGDLLAEYLARRPGLMPDSAEALGQRLYEYFAERLHTSAPQNDALPTFQTTRAALENLFWGFRQAQREQRRGGESAPRP